VLAVSVIAISCSIRLSDISNGLRMKGKPYHLLYHTFNPILTNSSLPF
jgi:hypothetical protein